MKYYKSLLFPLLLVAFLGLPSCKPKENSTETKQNEQQDSLFAVKSKYLKSIHSLIEKELNDRNFAEAERLSVELTQGISQLKTELADIHEEQMFQSLGGKKEETDNGTEMAQNLENSEQKPLFESEANETTNAADTQNERAENQQEILSEEETNKVTTDSAEG